MKELSNFSGPTRSSENNTDDPRRQSYTSSTVGELNFGSFPLKSLKSG